MDKTIQKPLNCRNARCGASCSPMEAQFWSDNPQKCPNFEYDPIGYDQEKLNKEYQRGRTDAINEYHEKYAMMADIIEASIKKGRVDAVDELWELANENSFDDGIYQSITLGQLDEIGLRVKGE